MLGKLATHEFAFGGPELDLPWPPARNPWDRGHFTGGSSSGTGAAVAAGLTWAAPGRTPAARSAGRRRCAASPGSSRPRPVQPRGILPLALTLDQAGPMAWTAEDCALLLQGMAGHDPDDPATSIARWRTSPASRKTA